MKKILSILLILTLGTSISVAQSNNYRASNRQPSSCAPTEALMCELREQIGQLNQRLNQQDQRLTELAAAPNTSSAPHKYPRNCADIPIAQRNNGIVSIQVDLFDENPFQVACHETTHGGGWTVIQRRLDGSVNFDLKWADYKKGFGNLAGEFFIGLDKLYALTNDVPQELIIVMSDFEGVTKYAQYDEFTIGDESEDYELKILGRFTGDAKDSLIFHWRQKFTTKDRDNDANPDANCAVNFQGAWWHNNCHLCNLNGMYQKNPIPPEQFAHGINWWTWHGHTYSLKTVEMMIRPNKNLAPKRNIMV